MATCGYWTKRLHTDTAANPKLAGQLCDGCGSPVRGEVVIDTCEHEQGAKLYHDGCQPYIRSAAWQRRGA